MEDRIMVTGDINQFVKDNHPLVLYFIKKYPLKSIDFEEYEAELLVALWQAALKFDPDLGFKFSTYAMNGLFFARRRLLDRNRLIYGNKKGSRLRVAQLRLNEAEEPARNLRIEIGQQWTEEDCQAVRSNVDKLPRREREVMQGYFAGKSCAEIARDGNTSRQWISNVYWSGVGKLKRMMVEAE